jgi:hypothetical protein
VVHTEVVTGHRREHQAVIVITITGTPGASHL